MIKQVLAVCGLIILLTAVMFNNGIAKGERIAASLNNETKSHGIIDGPPPCNWEIKDPEPVMSENKTQAILINTSNLLDENCETLLYLRAPNFDISPNKEEQKIVLESTSSGSISWIITPKKTGSYELSITDNLNTKIYGINVKNMFGLTAVQAKIASTLGTVFGPMLTIPWWWDRLRKKT